MRFTLAMLCISAVPVFAVEPRPHVLHLPGVGGHMLIDDLMTRGLQDGGLGAEVEIDDWTDGDPGLPALARFERNQQRAGKVADRITALYRADPKQRLILTSHSGGTAIAVWALERLPADVHVDTLIMLASALSPEYDLSRALSHVSGKAYAFTSTLDPVVGLGTRTLGTMDRAYIDSGGNVGFSMPAAGDPKQYAKFIGVPYDSAWVRLGNFGDHIGTMNRAFASRVLTPLLVSGQLPSIAPATQPATRPRN